FEESEGRFADMTTLRTMTAEVVSSGVLSVDPSVGTREERDQLKAVAQGEAEVLLQLMERYCKKQAGADSCMGETYFSLQELQILWNRHGPVLHGRAPVAGAIPLVIYAYNRPKYLTEMLSALKKVRGVENALIVVSLDAVVPVRTSSTQQGRREFE
ncbi:hypothetical protein T484DRAFT_1784633, partial [Baffinella frigidus]